MTHDANGKHANDDDDRGDLLLEEPAAQQRHADSRQAGDQLVEVGLERGDLLNLEARGTKGGVLGEGAVNRVRNTLAAAVSGLGDGVPVNVSTLGLGDRGDDRRKGDGNQRWTSEPMTNIPRMEAPSVILPIRPPPRSSVMAVPSL